MNRLVLIGNGFDLAHGLPTSYQDFINWYWNKRRDGLVGNISKESQDVLCTIKCWNMSCNEAVFNDLTLKQSYDMDIYYYLDGNKKEYDIYFSPFFARIIKSIETKKWVDIENEYYLTLKYDESQAKEVNEQLEYLRILLVEYLNKIDYDKILETNDEIWDKIHNVFDPDKECSVFDRNRYQKSLFTDIEDIMLLSFH